MERMTNTKILTFLLLASSAFAQTNSLPPMPDGLVAPTTDSAEVVTSNPALRISTRMLVDVEFEVVTNRVYTLSTAGNMTDRFSAYAGFNERTFRSNQTVRITFDTSIADSKFWRLEHRPLTTNTVVVASLIPMADPKGAKE